MGQVIGQSDKTAGTPATEKADAEASPRHGDALPAGAGRSPRQPEVPRNVADLLNDGQLIPGLL